MSEILSALLANLLNVVLSQWFKLHEANSRAGLLERWEIAQVESQLQAG
ncbi:MAG: hypothetical protein HC768_06065 [Acaryochloris sp. CRU_2_0]|nr:hypothetical protein [Acaryochloris sp. CRU_2_0]